MGIRFLKIAAAYLLIGVGMGVYMGISHQFALHPVHAHVNLLGWASLALAGLIYVQFPDVAKTKLAHLHFWMHNLSLPVLMVALALLLSGNEAMEPVVGIASITTALGIALFVVNVLLYVKSSERHTSMPTMATPQALAK